MQSLCIFVTESLTNRGQTILLTSKDVVGTRNAWSSQRQVFLKIGENVAMLMAQYVV